MSSATPREYAACPRPLDGCLAKLGWAKLKLQELEAEVAKAAPYTYALRFEQDFHADTSTIEVTLQGVPQTRTEWSLLAADFVQNLRCALNYLVWELSRWNLLQQGITRDPDRATQFPIHTVLGDFHDWRLRDAHPDHVARIKTLQPNAADSLMDLAEIMLRLSPAENIAKVLSFRHPLGHLVRLTNDDKHRVLPGLFVHSELTIFGDVMGIDCVVLDVHRHGHSEIQNGTKWAEIKVAPTGLQPKVKMNDEIVFADISFDRCRMGIGLPAIYRTVEAIIREFEPVIHPERGG